MGDSGLVLPLDHPEADLATVGGKGASLARLARAGLPVPPGFHVTTHARDDATTERAIRAAYEGMGAVAVRSSATAEDLPELSFAGQHDSFLNVAGADAVVEAVRKCWASLKNPRAAEYRLRHGVVDAAMAVVVQEMVPADAAGVLFTADPITGAAEMVVNAAWGLGESLVGGDVTPDGQVLTEAQIAELSGLGREIHALYGVPMDIEWTLHNGRFAIVQARPITALTEEWNDSKLGDFLWTSVNLGEAVPSVMTPMTWSLVRVLSQQANIGGFPVTGNIGGRFYLNLSVVNTVRPGNEDLLGRAPEPAPPLPISKTAVLRSVLKSAPPLIKQGVAYRLMKPSEVPQLCSELRQRIRETTTPQALVVLWRSDVDDLLHNTARTLDAGARMVSTPKVAGELRQLVGEQDAHVLLTGLGELASLGPLRGLARLRRGEISRADFARDWGHRCPDEFEVSVPRPGENPHWEMDVDPEELLRNQDKARQEAWQRLVERHPRKAKRIRKQLDRAARTARAREHARSEMVRTFWVFRDFVLRAGELTGRDDLFFLSFQELLAVLDGGAMPDVAPRRRAYDRYRALPVYPAFIRGTFEPEKWRPSVDEGAITGFPGMAGVVEGTARVVSTVEEASTVAAGEILVTTVTNVGWTPLFPRAAAIVTDVGAPLSHAAIVARELGIPAVVGCGNATSRIATGDQIRVDGAAGTVTLLE